MPDLDTALEEPATPLAPKARSLDQVFKEMRDTGKLSKHPLRESIGQWSNLKLVLLALLGAMAVLLIVLFQGAEGILATVVNGQTMIREGQPTGNLPGKLLRAKLPG